MRGVASKRHPTPLENLQRTITTASDSLLQDRAWKENQKNPAADLDNVGMIRGGVGVAQTCSVNLIIYSFSLALLPIPWHRVTSIGKSSYFSANLATDGSFPQSTVQIHTKPDSQHQLNRQNMQLALHQLNMSGNGQRSHLIIIWTCRVYEQAETYTRDSSIFFVGLENYFEFHHV